MYLCFQAIMKFIIMKIFIMFFSWEILESTVTKKVIGRFYNLGEENF